MAESTTAAPDQENWPLCRKYLLLKFETLRVPIKDGGTVSDRTSRWAFGVLSNGESELLGVWPEPSPSGLPWDTVFEDLSARGVERIQFVLSDEPTASQISLSTAYPGAVAMPSSKAEHAQALSRRLRPTKAAMRNLQAHVERAIHRHSPFSDAAEATNFVMAALLRVDRKRERASRTVSLFARKPIRGSRTASL
jgi:Transposase, Mutator family